MAFKFQAGCRCCPTVGQCSHCDNTVLAEQIPITPSGVVNKPNLGFGFQEGCDECESVLNGNEFILDYDPVVCAWATTIYMDCRSYYLNQGPVYYLRLGTQIPTEYVPTHGYTSPGWYLQVVVYNSIDEYNLANYPGENGRAYWYFDWETEDETPAEDDDFDCTESRTLIFGGGNNILNDEWCDWESASFLIEPEAADEGGAPRLSPLDFSISGETPGGIPISG
jgi:hypothetical protein